MHPFRILAIATAIEACFGSALLALLGLGGAWSGWLDVVNCIAPLMLGIGAAAALAAWLVIPRSRLRAACLGLAGFAVLYGGFMVAPDLLGRPPRAGRGPAAPAYRVVAANVFRNNDSPFSAARVLVRRGADAVIVAEADGSILAARPVLAQAYPYVVDCPEGGVEIWLKTPILAHGCALAAPPGSYHAWGKGFVWARTRGPDGRPLTVAGVHLGRPYPPRRQAVERRALPAGLAPYAGDRLILAGDFNMTPWSFAMRRLDHALAPLRRQTHGQATYPARINLTQTDWAAPWLPIDHVYASRQWSDVRLTTFRIPNSDHLGVEVEAAP